jgi:hypothetical protein
MNSKDYALDVIRTQLLLGLADVHTLRLRDGYAAQLVLPDLTKPEAERLCAFVMALAVEKKKEET